ncbi:hypothetical protein JTE90_026055 [Oedothorax gibbosus]|uniref:Uncharacterized protein n=1 Tax=Oedothorax gibbosus TaxID=931172 RepID=A0AAV6UEE2_9ARAC|nr:hypothetical protein JTE90_026055 [Oedothorax gibbosus]
MNTPIQERLQRMSYSELRKIARKSGINGKQKAKALIASILESAGSADDSFLALELQIMNSCKENKIKKFEEDRGTPIDTPRRGTYTVDDQADVSMALDNDLISSSASPALYKTPEEHNNPITLTRSSVKKSQKKRKVSFVTPIRRSARLSCLTPQFSSVKDRPKTPIPSRDSSGRKGRVAATSATKMFSGSLFISNSARKLSEGGRRPSTPMPNRKPKRMKLSSPGILEAPSDTPVSTPVASEGPHSEQKQLTKITPTITSKSALTPVTLSITKGRRSSPRHSADKPSALMLNSNQISGTTPESQLKKTPLQLSSLKDKRITPKSQLKKTPLQLSSLKDKRITPKSQLKTTPLQAPIVTVQRATPKSQLKKTPSQSSGVKSKTTPNFIKLHQKQFDKMESIDEYINRKQMNSTKKIHQQRLQDSSKKMVLKKNSRIPQKFGGIPFVPSITSTADMKTDFGFKKMKANLTPGKRLPAVKFGKHNNSIVAKKIKGETKAPRLVTKENTPLPKKFDLKASLSRKLTYKPHKGPLKPLGQVNLNASVFASAPAPPPKIVAPENRVIKAKRVEIRGVLQGVRKNKRFELQMKNRKP